MAWLRNEPVSAQTILTSVLSLVVPALGLLVAFGILPWTKEQAGAVNTFVNAAVAVTTAIVGFLFVRTAVTPLANPKTNEHPLIEADLTHGQLANLRARPDVSGTVRGALMTNEAPLQGIV